MFVKILEWNGNTHILPKSNITLVTDDTSDVTGDKKKKTKTCILVSRNKETIELCSSEPIGDIEAKLQEDNKGS